MADNSSQSFKFPTNLTIVGLGGCGKKIAREICNQDWLLHNYSSDVNKLKIYTMDTDANENSEDHLREKEIMEKVENMGGAGKIEFKSFYLPDLANITYVSDLTRAEVSASIKRSQSIKTWWLHDPEENDGLTFHDLKSIDPDIMDDFGGGVHRRRAVSKAILYKVFSEGQANGFPTFAIPGDTAIIVGIGGGTGSGMFIDLARYIRKKRENKIYLFAVLPTTKEGVKEQLNAAITLTELEYLNVSKDRLFDHVIFISLGPTEYMNGQHELDAVSEFDKVFPQIVTNFFHILHSDLSLIDARNHYSSFIFADSHIIEYPVEELKELKEQYSQIIQELGEINAIRNNINKTIEGLLTDFNIVGESTPTMEVFEFIKTEYRNIEKVWTNNIAKLLNYYSVGQIEEFIKYNISDIQFEKIVSYNDLIYYISRFNSFAQGVEQDKLKDEIDKKLFRLLPEALDTLKKNASLFKRVSSIENEDCRSVMIDILKGKKDISPLLNALNTKKLEKQNLDKELKPLEQRITELNTLPIEVEKKIKDKLSDIDLDLESYAKIYKNVKSLPDKEQKLKEKLDRYIENLSTEKVKGNDKNSWFMSAGTKDIRTEIEEISKEHEFDLESLNKFIDSLTYYYFYKSKVKEVEKGGLRAVILGNKKQLIKKYKEHAEEEEYNIKSNMKNWAIRIDTPFNITIPENFLTGNLVIKVEAIRERIYDSILEDLNTSIDNDKLDRIFDTDDRKKIRQSLREYLTELHLNTANFFKNRDELKKEIEDKNREIEEKQLQINMLDKVDASLADTFSSRKNFDLHYSHFHEHFVTINKKIAAGERTKKGEYVTKFGSVNPQILSLVEGRSDKKLNPDMGNLDMDKNGKDELDKLISLAKSTYQDLFESRKLGVNSLKIPFGTETWSFGKAALVVSSTSAYVRSELMHGMIRSDINKSLSLNHPTDALLTPHGHTRPWEIALTFFAASSFLDNIHPMVAGGGYWEIYAMNKENILHHVLRLQDGEYITRKELLSSEKAGNIANNENRAIFPQEIVELYTTKPLKEALGIGNK